MNRTLDKMNTLAKGLVTLSGNFLLNGTSAPSTPKGSGITPTRTGVGAFKLTLKEKVADLISAQVQLGLGTPAALSIQLGTAAKNASGFWEIPFTILSGSTPTEVAAGAGNAVWWEVVAAQSGVVVP